MEVRVYEDMGHLDHFPRTIPEELSRIIRNDVVSESFESQGYNLRSWYRKNGVPSEKVVEVQNQTFRILYEFREVNQ